MKELAEISNALPPRGKALSDQSGAECSATIVGGSREKTGNSCVEQMLKYSRKQGAQRKHKMRAKHGNETLSAVTPAMQSSGPSQEGAGGSAADPMGADGRITRLDL